MRSEFSDKRLLSVRHASYYLDMTEGALRKAIERGTLPAQCVVRLGGRIFVDRQRIDEWLDKRARR